MFCGNCGKQNPDNANVCGYCGYHFRKIEEPCAPVSDKPVCRPAKASAKKSKKGIGTLLIGVIIGVVIAAALGVITFRLTSDNKEGPTETVVRDDIDTKEDKIIDKYTDSKNKNSAKPVEDEPEEDEKPETEEKEKPEDITEKKPEKYVPTKKDEYLATAQSIEEYSSMYLDTASTQHQMNSESAVVFEKWDILLNDVYNYLKTTLPAGEFAALESDEVDWIIEKENAISAASGEWEGGSMEPYAKNATAIRYTEERCYYLISLIN